MPTAPNIGDLLDSKYRVQKRLGGGGFGDVYLAEDELLGRQVAIKLLRDRDPGRQADLVHEMRSLDQLHHPAVVTFFHHFVDEQLLFLVMEYCAGGSLRSRMRQQPAHLHTVMQWGKDLADTLYFVHQQGIVHHDIKPDNILFTAEGVLKIGDLGVANRNIGTGPYLAPEMLLGEVNTGDVRVDVYALGITILELLQNRNPFQGLPPAESLRAKIRHEFIPADMERWVQDLLSKATHPTPELRFQSMQEFREPIESKHVSYVFDRSRVQAHALAARAEKLLARKQATAASKCISQALYACPDCVSALIAAGRHSLFINRIAEAKQYFDQALALNPRTNIQKELGWLCLEASSYSQAISLLTDHLQRNAADYEAFNLLLECFYRTERYEVGLQVAKLMIDERAPSDCFENNGLLCGLLSDSTEEELVKRALEKLRNPFIGYNVDVLMQAQAQLKSLVLFENYRFGLSTRKENTLTVTIDGRAREMKTPVITIGRLEENEICLADTNVSRRHCALVNYLDDVWVYDLGSTRGVFVDGKRIERKAYIEGVHAVRLGQTELMVCSKLGLLV
jgi:tetratricopeptide (TPR) repeat protein